MVTYRKGDVVRLTKKWDDRRDVGALATVLVDFFGLGDPYSSDGGVYLQVAWHNGADGRYYHADHFELIGGPW